MKDNKNLFCHKSDLTNESSVEQFFVNRLLEFLNYPDKEIKPKNSLKHIAISKGSKSENYKPDYVCVHEQKPKVVIDAKSTDENPDDFVYQVSGYALALNRKYKGENPVRYTILTNGLHFKLYNWDEDEPVISMSFDDFSQTNPKFKKLVELLDYKNIKSQTGQDEILIEDFMNRTSVEDLKASFRKCHNLIWKKEKISPTDAFYEFSKIIFVKLNEDKRLRNILNQKRKLKRQDFKFSVNWLKEREDETENPLSSIIFADLIKKLNEDVEKRKKKPIFLDNFIDLKTDTIREVVKIMQDKDLFTVDEDLNGRMFEEFLNATIRGKELGQYFTPRKIVKFMVKLSKLKIIYNADNEDYYTDIVLDGCCGSAGFLIDAMADLIGKVKKRNNLKPYEEDLIQKIQTASLFGIEANPKVSRIARMNMHVHEDGGSRIYCADSLDKTLSITKGTRDEVKKDIEELKEYLIKKELKFDVVLTNPPFSMAYKKTEKDEKRILQQYANEGNENLTYEKGTKKLKPSVKSNVLFVARYSELLKIGGKLFIILDNSVLNSYSHREYRDFIRNNFIVNAIFSLPTHTFVNQQAGGITSILYLEKRKSPNQQQNSVFARVIHHVGHSKSGKEENFDDFDYVLKEYEKYQQEGKLYLKGTTPIKDYEHDDLFLIEADKINERMDVFFHQPSYAKLLLDLKKSEEKGHCVLKKLEDFTRVKTIDEEDKEKEDKDIKVDENTLYKYVEISSIDKERGFFIKGEWEEDIKDNLPSRAKLHIEENDVLFSKPYRSLKKVAIVPEELNGSLASSGFYGIRPKHFKEACLLWGIFRSELIQKQLIHISSGYTQRELSEEYLKKYLIIPIPKDEKIVSDVISNNIKIAIDSRNKELEALKTIVETPKHHILNLNGKTKLI